MTDEIAVVDEELLIWSNTDNTAIYENMPIDEFYKIAVLSGLDTGKDIEVIWEYIQSAESILEVGAGYGRVLNHLITRGYRGALSAVERSEKLSHWLKSQYQHCVTFHEGTVMAAKNNSQYDLILWMWSGFAEFASTEQMQVLNKLSKCLMPSGKIIIDMVPLNEKTLNSIELTKQEQIIETMYGTDHCYVPSAQEIFHYINTLNLKLVEKIAYQPLPNRTRWLYVISN